MDKGLIFDIERFSSKDGPGIRTVVFFKGCNLSCKWCHNPESIHALPELMFSSHKCVLCERCVKACRRGAHCILDGMHMFDTSLCEECLECAKVCYSGALRKVGQWMTAEEVMAEVLPDKMLFEKSGGGVTLSGGEVMLQHSFASKILAACKDNKISTAIETNLNVPWQNYEEILPMTDMVFADIKHISDDVHRKWTGSGNDRILGNLDSLKRSGQSFVIRTPIIPGVNDSIETIEGIVSEIADAGNLLYYELLDYNPLGTGKGTLISPPDIVRFKDADKVHTEKLAKYASKYVRVKLNGKVIE